MRQVGDCGSFDRVSTLRPKLVLQHSPSGNHRNRARSATVGKREDKRDGDGHKPGEYDPANTKPVEDSSKGKRSKDDK